MADDDFIPDSEAADGAAPSPDTFDAIDAALMGEAGQDDRVGSGVPDALRTGDDDFLAMSGIAPAASLGEAEPPATAADDGLNFYESGVEDVDAVADSVADAVPEAPPATSMLADVEASLASPVGAEPAEDLKDIMADLAGPESVARTTSAAVPASDDKADEIPQLLDQVKADIIGELKDDLSALKAASTPAPDSNEALPELLAQVKADIIGGIQDDLTSLKESQREAVDALKETREADIVSPTPDDSDVTIGTAPSVDAAPELAEAERLIQELQQQPRETDEEPIEKHFEPIDLDAIAAESEARTDEDEPVLDGEFGNERDATVYGQPGSKKRRKGSRKERFRRRAKRYVVVCAVILAIVVVGWPYIRSGWSLLMPSLQSPNEVYTQAEKLYDEEQPIQSSKAYQSFYQEFPNDPRAEGALFKAAYVLLSAPPNLGTQHFRDAVALFERYETTFPESERKNSIQGMKGLAYHLMGDHQQAITALTANAKAFSSDEAMAIPMLRTLARSHAAREEFQEAETRYRQAASMRSNFTVDEDYSELADLTVLQAKRTSDRAEQTALLEAAEGHVEAAIRSHYIDQQRRAALEKKSEQIRAMIIDGVEVEASGVVTQGETIPLDPAEPVEETMPVEAEEFTPEDVPEMDGPAEDVIEDTPDAAPIPDEIVLEEVGEESAPVEFELPAIEEAPVDVEPSEEPAMPAPVETVEESSVEPEADVPAEVVEEAVGEPTMPENSVVDVVEETEAEVTPEPEISVIPEVAPEATPEPKPTRVPAREEGSMTLEAPAPQ